MSIIGSLLLSLFLTLAVELGLAAVLRVRGLDLLIVALANCLTNPLVNYAFDWALVLCPPDSPLLYCILAALEIAAVTVEALLYKKLLTYRRIGAWRLSLLLNGASFATGLALSWVMTIAK